MTLNTNRIINRMRNNYVIKRALTQRLPFSVSVPLEVDDLGTKVHNWIRSAKQEPGIQCFVASDMPSLKPVTCAYTALFGG
jgi:hypothetical protein